MSKSAEDSRSLLRVSMKSRREKLLADRDTLAETGAPQSRKRIRAQMRKAAQNASGGSELVQALRDGEDPKRILGPLGTFRKEPEAPATAPLLLRSASCDESAKPLHKSQSYREFALQETPSESTGAAERARAAASAATYATPTDRIARLYTPTAANLTMKSAVAVSRWIATSKTRVRELGAAHPTPFRDDALQETNSDRARRPSIGRPNNIPTRERNCRLAERARAAAGRVEGRGRSRGGAVRAAAPFGAARAAATRMIPIGFARRCSRRRATRGATASASRRSSLLRGPRRCCRSGPRRRSARERATRRSRKSRASRRPRTTRRRGRRPYCRSSNRRRRRRSRPPRRRANARGAPTICERRGGSNEARRSTSWPCRPLKNRRVRRLTPRPGTRRGRKPPRRRSWRNRRRRPRPIKRPSRRTGPEFGI